MPKYKIQKEIIFSKKTQKQIGTFLDEYQGLLNLTQILDQKGNTALHQCAYFNFPKLLYKYIAHMERYAAKIEHQNPANLILQFVNKQNLDGLSPIHFAAYKGHTKIIQILQKYGGNIYVRTALNGQNVLHLAAQNDKVQSFIYFQYSIDLNSKDTKNYTPLHWAAFMNSESVVTYLLAQKSIQLDCKQKNEQTPLHIATAYGNTKIVKRLLRAGADRNILNNKKETAIKIAKDNEFKNIQKLLSENDSLLHQIKLCLNLATDYRPKDKSMTKPIIFITFFCIYLLSRLFLFSPGIDQIQNFNNLTFYAQIVGNMLLLIFYLSLLIPQRKKINKSYAYYLNAQPNIPLKDICLICIREKPPRSIHCDICKTCISRYDHHCYWINNCVGKYNHNRFLIFIILFMLFLWYLGFVGVCLIYNTINSQQIFVYKKCQAPIIVFLFSSLCLLIFVIFLIPITMLVIVQIKNFCLNKTTYERFTKDKALSFSESNSHLISEEIQRNIRKRKRKWSIKNAQNMMCSEETVQSSRDINKSDLVKSLSSQ